ncbi:MAG: precorrin-2 dehydrogenase/sirohydrochlorin ferrochelatase family protein, partial [Acidimicrobiia bacterium]
SAGGGPVMGQGSGAGERSRAGAGANRQGVAGYPVNLVVRDRRCVVVGAGRIAARKIEGLFTAGARVHVVAPELGDDVRAWVDAGTVTVSERAFEAGDLDDAWLATTATGVPAVDRAVFEAGEARHVWVNSADDPANCSFTLMSVVRQGDLVVAIGSNGRSPALATYLRDHVRTEMGPEWAALLELLAEAREEMRAAGRSSETADWRRALDSGILDLVREGRDDEAKELLRSCL